MSIETLRIKSAPEIEGCPYANLLIDAMQAEIDQLRKENTRIVAESKQCHSRNDEMCKDLISKKFKKKKFARGNRC